MAPQERSPSQGLDATPVAQLQGAQPLRCSIVVPVYNGGHTIQACLDALARQTLDAGTYEILVVDDGSTDDTGTRVRAWMERHPQVAARLIQQANAGPAAARNRGVEAARAPVVLFTDADCAPMPHWAEAMLAAFESPDVAGAKGTYLTDQTGLVPRFVQAEYEDRYDRMRHLDRIDFVDTYSAAYRRDVFLENGGFDPTFTTASVEDQEFSFRLAAKGYRLVFVPRAQVKHLHDRNVWEYARRKYAIGFWKALLIAWHPERAIQDSHTPQVLKLQMALWAGILGALPLALLGAFWPGLRWLWALIGGLGIVFLATAVPFQRKVARRSLGLALVSPGLLAVRAVALGLGYVVGTIHFTGTPPGTDHPVIPGWKRLVKRAMDIVGALLGLAASAPLILVAGLAIKLDSPGPIFFVQTRIGEHGRPFRMVKLRTMTPQAEERLAELLDLTQLQEPAYKLRRDPRVTRVGRWLRRFSLDELPQFWNVLRGEMSLVGPRPEEARIVALYTDHQRRRLTVKPGMTGPMQVNGRGDLSFEERLRLEIDYIEHYSLLRDVQILLQTVPAVLRGRGAY